MAYKIALLSFSGIQQGNLVSLFADVEGKCRKGLTRTYEGRKLFLGNGRALLGRNDIFCSGDTVRWVRIFVAHRQRFPRLSELTQSMLLMDTSRSVNLHVVPCAHVQYEPLHALLKLQAFA